VVHGGATRRELSTAPLDSSPAYDVPCDSFRRDRRKFASSCYTSWSLGRGPDGDFSQLASVPGLPRGRVMILAVSAFGSPRRAQIARIFPTEYFNPPAWIGLCGRVRVARGSNSDRTASVACVAMRGIDDAHMHMHVLRVGTQQKSASPCCVEWFCKGSVP